MILTGIGLNDAGPTENIPYENNTNLGDPSSRSSHRGAHILERIRVVAQRQRRSGGYLLKKWNLRARDYDRLIQRYRRIPVPIECGEKKRKGAAGVGHTVRPVQNYPPVKSIVILKNAPRKQTPIRGLQISGVQRARRRLWKSQVRHVVNTQVRKSLVQCRLHNLTASLSKWLCRHGSKRIPRASSSSTRIDDCKFRGTDSTGPTDAEQKLQTTFSALKITVRTACSAEEIFANLQPPYPQRGREGLCSRAGNHSQNAQSRLQSRADATPRRENCGPAISIRT